MSQHKPLTLNSRMPFGKHKGMLLRDICKVEPTYIKWLVENSSAKLEEEVVIAAGYRYAKEPLNIPDGSIGVYHGTLVIRFFEGKYVHNGDLKLSDAAEEILGYLMAELNRQ